METTDIHFDEKLAAIVASYPALWDRRSSVFKNKLMKEKALKCIANSLHCTVDMVIARFKFLREKYRKEKLKIENQIKSGETILPFEPWPMMEVLRFLDTVQLKRKRTGNMPFQLSSCSSGVSADEDISMSTDSSLPAEDVDCSLVETSSKVQHMLDRLLAAAEATAISVMEPEVPVGNNRCGLFGQYVGETLKKMNASAAEEAMFEISTTLYNISKKAHYMK